MWKFISSWLGFSLSAVTWQLSWYQNSHQDRILTLQEVLDLLASACECSHWLLCTPPPPQTVLRWTSFLGSEKVTLENILVYYYIQRSKINHTRYLWNCREKDGTSSCLPFLDFYSVSIGGHWVTSWRVHVFLREVPCSLKFHFFKPTGLISFCLFFKKR